MEGLAYNGKNMRGRQREKTLRETFSPRETKCQLELGEKRGEEVGFVQSTRWAVRDWHQSMVALHGKPHNTLSAVKTRLGGEFLRTETD